jgi:predicted DNA-binding transcriptional regulator YafY
MILSLGADAMAQSFDAHYRAAAQSAASKITAALPERLRSDVAALRERIYMGVGGSELAPEVGATLRALRGAVITCQRVRFRYHTRFPVASERERADGDAPPWREADPYALIRSAGAWYLTAYCHLRQDRRNFRLERIEELTILDATFARPRALQARPRRQQALEGIEARIQFDALAARWARESPSFFTTAQADTADGGLLVTLHMRQEEEITQWLLGWGSRVRVLAPPSLRQRIRDEAAALLALYQADQADD